MTTNGLGGVEKATQELLKQHVRTDAPTPFTTEGTLGHAGLVGANVEVNPITDTVQPEAAISAAHVAPAEASSGPRIMSVVRMLAKATIRPFSR